MIITIDGPAVSGKGTTARQIAQALSIYYLDTGSLYRAVGYLASQEFSAEHFSPFSSLTDAHVSRYLKSITYHYEQDRPHLYANGYDISAHLRTPQIDWFSSQVSQLASVRSGLKGLQEQLGREYSLVTDGRDCGSTIFPHAEYKFFLVATLEARVSRFLSDPIRGALLSPEQARTEIVLRDVRDISRTQSPLRVADDALIIDNSFLTQEETLALLLSYIR